MSGTLVQLAASAVLASTAASRAASGIAATSLCCREQDDDLPTGA